MRVRASQAADKLVEIESAVFGRHAAGLDAAAREVEPGIGVRRKLVGERDDVVARPPIEALGDQSDAGGCVGHQRDLFDRRANHSGGGCASRFDAARPFGPDRVALGQRFVRPSFAKSPLPGL